MRLTALALLVFVSVSTAGVKHSKSGPNIVVRGSTYEAVIAPDGCLTNLRIGGVEFLAPGVARTRGAYLYQGGVQRMDSVDRKGDKYHAKADVGSIEYKFLDDSMEWTVANASKAPLILFLVFRDDLDAGSVAGGALSPRVIVETGRRSIWFRDGSKLAIEGSDRFWGPFAGTHQVWEARIPPGGKRTVRLGLGPASKSEWVSLNKLLDPFGGRDVLVLSPREYQVIQRRSATVGEVLVSGRVKDAGLPVQVRFEGKSSGGEISNEWRAVALDAKTRRFAGRFTLPAGGWYRMSVRRGAGEAGGSEVFVKRFGMGEVFVGAGQSNSTNAGEKRTKQTSGMVASFNGTAWRLADDPQWGTHDTSGGGSFWPAFGDAMFARFGVPIGVAVTGHGGTSVNQWQPDGELYPWMMRRVYQLGPSGFRALLWHQGESDVRMKSDVFYRKMLRLIEGSKVDAGWEFPWFVAQVSYHSPKAPRFESTRSAHARLWREGIAERGPDTDTLTGDMRDRAGMGIHFSPKGLKKHGELWAELVAPYVERCLKE